MFSRFPSHSYRSKDFSNFSFNLHVLILISLFFLFCFRDFTEGKIELYVCNEHCFAFSSIFVCYIN